MIKCRETLRAVPRWIAGFVPSVIAASPAFAESSQPDFDWRSYFDWHSYTEWQWLLLGISIALLVVGVLLQSAQTMKSRRVSEQSLEPGDRYTRRIGTMPLERPRPVDVHS
jgi:hypothetical protein